MPLTAEELRQAIKDSIPSVRLTVELLHGLGVEIHSWENGVGNSPDSGDIKTEHGVLEVKALTTYFTGDKRDWPWPHCIVNEVGAADRELAQPLWGYFNWDDSMTNALFIHSRTRPDWYSVKVWDTRYQANRTYYHVKKKHVDWFPNYRQFPKIPPIEHPRDDDQAGLF